LEAEPGDLPADDEAQVGVPEEVAGRARALLLPVVQEDADVSPAVAADEALRLGWRFWE
jgi:hypothetical protein